MIIFSHLMDKTNVGDYHCNPNRYFDFPGSLTVDLRDLEQFLQNSVGRWDKIVIIFGGGGLIHPGLTHLMNTPLVKKCHRIAWGIGTNIHGETEILVPSFFKDFLLVGMRDYDSGYDFVPCASCMNPWFDNIPAPEHKMVILEHKAVKITNDAESNVMAMNNDRCDMVEVLEFLSRGETIWTNSYHGAYWGNLMFREVEIINPFSNRFSSLMEWRWDLENCRRRNNLFCNRVRMAIDSLELT